MATTRKPRNTAKMRELKEMVDDLQRKNNELEGGHRLRQLETINARLWERALTPEQLRAQVLRLAADLPLYPAEHRAVEFAMDILRAREQGKCSHEK